MIVKRESDETGEPFCYHFATPAGDCVQVVFKHGTHWELEINGDFVAELGKQDHPEGVAYMLSEALRMLKVIA